MQDYEAIAAQLANALRDMLKVGATHESRTDARIYARATLWNFDNGRLDNGREVIMPAVGDCFQCREPVQPEPSHPDECPFCSKEVHRP